MRADGRSIHPSRARHRRRRNLDRRSRAEDLGRTAFVAYTRDAAYASFEEDVKGMLKVGYLADVVVIDPSLLSIPPEEIRNANIVTTIVDGKVVYQR